MKQAVRDPLDLCRLLRLSPSWEQAAVQAARLFPVFAPLPFIGRIKPGDPHDPLLRQVLPLPEELDSAPGFAADPVGDRAAMVAPGLLRKYRGRVLMVTTGACAVHCRYCFRRHFPYDETPRSLADWQPALAAIAADRTLDEVILSGGDPLTVVDSQLARLVEELAAIAHIRRLRLHTRLPVMIPQRVTGELVEWLTGTRLTPLVVIHVNHPAELDADVDQALQQLTSAGIPLLNQAVLLRGINDDIDVLERLCRDLADRRVLPYYLHQLDRVAGAGHFETPLTVGRSLLRQLRRRLPGYAVPRYVRETAGQPHKVVLA